MNEIPAQELGVILLSTSFLAALIVGGVTGKLGGLELGGAAGAATVGAMALTAAWITWQADAGPDPENHRMLLIVFLLFGTVPLAMSLVLFASAWEKRAGAEHKPAPRSPAVLKACSWARVVANTALLAGVIVTFWYDDLRSVALAFPVIGGAALAHAVIGMVSE